MEEEIFITKNAKETQDLGVKFTQSVTCGDSVLLEGELGSGKTTFVQGAAKALKIKSRIISPTFVLVRSHKGVLRGKKINLYHIDLFRINDLNTVINLGLSEIFEDPDGITFIEWGKKSKNTKFNTQIFFEILNNNKRKITIKRNE